MAEPITPDCRAHYNHPPDERLRQCTDERAHLLAVNAELLEALKLMTPVSGFPKCDRRCASNVGAYDEDPRCDCGFEEIRENAETARAAIAKAEGRS